MQISGLPSTFLVSQVQLGQGTSDHAVERTTGETPCVGLIDTDQAKTDTASDVVGFADLLQQGSVTLPSDSLAPGWSQAGPVLLHIVEQSHPSTIVEKETVPHTISRDTPHWPSGTDLPAEKALPGRGVFAGVEQFLALDAEAFSEASSMAQKSGGRDAKAEVGQGAEDAMIRRELLPLGDGDQVFQDVSNHSAGEADGPRPKVSSWQDTVGLDPKAGSGKEAQAQEATSPAPARIAGPFEVSIDYLDSAARQALPVDLPAREPKLDPIRGNVVRELSASIPNAIGSDPCQVYPTRKLEQALPRIEPSMSIAPLEESPGSASAAGDIKPGPLLGQLPNVLFPPFTLEDAPNEGTPPLPPAAWTGIDGGEVYVPSPETRSKPPDRSSPPVILSPLFSAEREDIWTDQGMSAMPEVQSGSGLGSVHGGGKASVSILAQITPQLVERIAQGAMGTTTVTLSPEELGPVRMSFQPDAQSPDQIVVMLTFDRAETMDLFRRHADQLAEVLRTAGYSGVQLGFGGPGGDGFRQGADGNPPPPSATREAAVSDVNFTGAAPFERVGLGGLDLRL